MGCMLAQMLLEVPSEQYSCLNSRCPKGTHVDGSRRMMTVLCPLLTDSEDLGVSLVISEIHNYGNNTQRL